MKIAVVGAGAMGSLFGGLLAEGGNRVWLYDIWAEHVNAINQGGLQIEREGETRKVRPNATTDPQRIPPADLVIIFVKSSHTEAAAESAARMAGPDAFVLTLQNGMGNADLIAQKIDPDRVLAGTTSHGATLLGPGHIRHAGAGPTLIGAWTPSSEGDEGARAVAGCFSDAGIETGGAPEVRAIVWDKLFVNIGINAITALCGILNGQLLDLEVTRNLSRAAVEEALAVARAQGIAIREDPFEHVFKIAAATAANRSSMGQDVDAGRPTEIMAINGFVVREAERLGLAAPVNRTLTALIETLEHHFKA